LTIEFSNKQQLTRTINVSCLSRFLPRRGGILSRNLPSKAGLPNFFSCTQDKFVLVVAPALRSAQGARICTQFKSCTLTNFWLRDSLYPMTFAALSQGLQRDTAPVPPTYILYRDSFPAPIKLVPLTMLRMSGLSARHPDARFTRSGLKARNAQ